MRIITALTACVLALAVFIKSAVAEEFFFHDGDRIVVVGDSITVGGDYGRYIENFLRTRYPKWTLSVRNAGINGCTAQIGLPFIGSDVLAWKPTAVIVVWGMNDGRRTDGVEYYKAGIVPYVDKLRAAGVRVVLCSNSPLDIGDAPGQYADYNKSFDEMAQFAEGVARERRIPFADIFHFCHPLWGENRRREKPVPVSDQTLAGHSSDAVHARSPGQLTMAYVILKALYAPSEVSYASLDAGTGQADTRRCRVSGFKQEAGVLSFTRADEASPCFIDDRGALAFELVPFQDEFNRMTLQVRGLAPGNYELKVGGATHGQYSARQFADGINLSSNRQSPIYSPGRKVNDLVTALKGATYNARQVNFFQPPAWLKIPDLDAQRAAEFARLIPEFEKADAQIGAAAAPQPHRYEIRPVPSAEGKAP